MKIRPLHDRVIVKRTEEEKTSAGGIVIPDSAAEKPVKGEVIAVGNGKVLDNGEVRKLDRDRPLVLVSRDDAPFYSKPMLSNALAAGNRVLVKPSELAPRFADLVPSSHPRLSPRSSWAQAGPT